MLYRTTKRKTDKRDDGSCFLTTDYECAEETVCSCQASSCKAISQNRFRERTGNRQKEKHLESAVRTDRLQKVLCTEMISMDPIPHEKLPVELVDLARAQIDENLILDDLADIRTNGGMELKDFIAELEAIAIPNG
jgi:hypothetical protein